jgi:hypothetical protein
LAHLWETLSHIHFSHKGLSDVIKLDDLSAKGLNVKFDCRFHIRKSFLISVALPYYCALDADWIGDIAVMMFLNYYFYLSHHRQSMQLLENKSIPRKNVTVLADMRALAPAARWLLNRRTAFLSGHDLMHSRTRAAAAHTRALAGPPVAPRPERAELDFLTENCATFEMQVLMEDKVLSRAC